jgi:hypothetical protein
VMEYFAWLAALHSQESSFPDFCHPVEEDE